MVPTHDTLIPATTSWLNDPAAQEVYAVLAQAGHEVFFVGGCVRNALLKRADSDVDMSTDAPPERVMELARAAGLKAIPTGIDHGTITVVAKETPFEITTYRKDVMTDGRRAVVAFSKDITDDARRRDFTMNALYADRDGQVIDPLNGLPDLTARRVRFIEDPSARIREDYLRILRFFRFSAWYADPDEGFDSDTLDAIASELHGLETLSAERVGQELSKLLMAPDPAPAVATMRQINVLSRILPGADDRFLGVLIHLESATGVAPNWINRLAVLGGDKVQDRFRLSKANSKKLARVRDAGYGGQALHEVAYRNGLEIAQGAMLIRHALAEQPPEKATLEALSDAAAAVFPVSSFDLMPQLKGPALGAKLKELEHSWIASEFQLDKAALLKGL